MSDIFLFIVDKDTLLIMDLNFVPIRLSTLRSSHDFDFDIYVNVGDKFVMYIKNGDDIQAERLKTLKEKKVKKLFILDSDEPKYQAFLDKALFNAAADETISVEEKADMANGVASNATEDMMENHDSKEAFEGAEKAAKGLIEIIRENPGILRNLYITAKESDIDPLVKHSIGAAFLSLQMGQLMNFDEKIIEDMGVAGLVHDIGRVSMGDDDFMLFEMRKDEMNPEQFKRYKDHPALGHDLLDRKEYVNKNILDFVLTHEENKSGNGFPQGLQSLSPEQEVFSLCCAFDRMVSLLGMSIEEAFEDFKINQLGNYDLNLINAFKKMIISNELVAK